MIHVSHFQIVKERLSVFPWPPCQSQEGHVFSARQRFRIDNIAVDLSGEMLRKDIRDEQLAALLAFHCQRS